MLKQILSKKLRSDKIIVLIEDNPEYIAIFRDAVNKINSKCQIFNDDSEAWEFILSNNKEISLIVSCKLSKEINGLSFLRRLKAKSDLKNIPVIMQSIDKKSGKEKEAITLGARFYVKKPFNSRKLYSLMKTTIRRPNAASDY